MSLGTLFINGTNFVSSVSGYTFAFETVMFDPSGMAIDQLLNIDEELSDVGIDKRRWRRINKQFRPFRVQTTASFSTYALGIADHRRYNLSIGAFGDLSATLYGVVYNWRNVKILDCIPTLRAGTMTGSGISTSLAVIIADWAMVLAQDPGNT